MALKTHAYPVEIFWSDEDDGFIAIVPDFPGCSSFGNTRAEAAREIEDAMQVWITTCEKAGNPVPQPGGIDGQ